MGLEMSRWTHLPDITIVSGGASGADTLAHVWADALGYEFIEFPANWKKYGKSAGMIRNRKMIDETDPERVLVFYGPEGETPGSKYTEEYARGKGIPVEVFYEQRQTS